MSRITKEIASVVAKQLTADKQTEQSVVRAEQREFIRSVYLKKLPDAVKECFEKHPDYFRRASSIYINGAGLPQGYKTYSIGDSLPSINGDRISLNDKDANKVQALEDKATEMQKKINSLRENIEVALYNLRTYNNVEREFPEAFKLLPASQVNTGLMVNIKDIRCQLDNANCA